jgi:hypothetical protein
MKFDSLPEVPLGLTHAAFQQIFGVFTHLNFMGYLTFGN